MVRSSQNDQIAKSLPLNCARTEDGALMITLNSPQDKQAVMKKLTEICDIDEIRVFEPSLNDIFVEYAGDQT